MSIDVLLILAPFCRSAPNMSLFPPGSIPTKATVNDIYAPVPSKRVVARDAARYVAKKAEKHCPSCDPCCPFFTSPLAPCTVPMPMLQFSGLV